MKFSKYFNRKKRLRGGVDGIACGVLFGWAVDSKNITTPVVLEIFVDNALVGKTVADLPRPDITHAVCPGGRCGFTFDLRAHLAKVTAYTIQVRAEVSGAELTGSPIEITETYGSGSLDGINGVIVSGWAVLANPNRDFATVEIIVDGKTVGRTTADLDRQDLRLAGLPRSLCGFQFTLPDYLFDGEKHVVGARIPGSGFPLRGGEKSFCAAIKGHIDHFSLNRVSGWAANLHAQDAPLKLDVYLNDELVATTETSFPRPDVASNYGLKAGSANFGFEVVLPQPMPTWNTQRLRVCVGNTKRSISGKEHVLIRNDFVVHVLEGIASTLFSQNVSPASPSQRDMSAVRQHFFPQIIEQFRKNYASTYVSVELPAAESSQTEREAGGQNALVDVIIPVYKGYQETLDCIESVLRTQTTTNFELIVINDHSPDVALTAKLQKLSTETKFTLLENETNQGFVATVNRGMKIHPTRDVLLLNSDTVVPSGWLEGLRRAAYSSPGIGTVTPFSNRATICSLPRTCQDNEMPHGLSVDDLNKICMQVNKEVTVDIPTAIGFAMYIRRETLNEVGYFDEEKWDKGYGEENEFCIRASDRGWRHLAACDVFVQHHGSVSFDAEKSPRVMKNLAKLNQLYPDYPGKIQRFIKADPLAKPRGRINVELLKRVAERYVLFVTHGLGGGTEKAIRDLCESYKKNGITGLILRSTPKGNIELSPVLEAYEKTLTTEYPCSISTETLAEHLQGLPIKAVQFHHTLGFSKDIWKLPEMLNLSYEVMIHDFYLVCPRINLIDDTGVYCGQPDISVCERCLKTNGFDHDIDNRLNELGGSAAKWQEFHALQLSHARRVLAPSEDTKRRINTYLPTQEIEVVPHPEPEFVFKQREWDGSLPYRVAVIGAIGPHKGVNLLLACARYAERRALPIKFVVIGYTSCDEAFARYSNVEITGRYKGEELEGVLQRTRCTVALFLSLWPETFSYTLTEACRLGLHPVVLNIGAPPDRIREMKVGTVLPFGQDPQIILSSLLNVLGGHRVKEDSSREKV